MYDLILGRLWAYILQLCCLFISRNVWKTVIPCYVFLHIIITLAILPVQKWRKVKEQAQRHKPLLHVFSFLLGLINKSVTYFTTALHAYFMHVHINFLPISVRNRNPFGSHCHIHANFLSISVHDSLQQKSYFGNQSHPCYFPSVFVMVHHYDILVTVKPPELYNIVWRVLPQYWLCEHC